MQAALGGGSYIRPDILKVRIRPVERSYTLICHSQGNHSIDLDEMGRVVGWTILDAPKQPEIIGEALAMFQQSLNVRQEDAPRAIAEFG